VTGGPAAGRWLPVTIAFTLLAIVMTWPLTRDIATWIAWDMGDPVFNSWVMMWTGGQALAVLGGDFNALHRFWDGNIFHPEPLTIAYSEHLTPQMLQALPIWALSGNIVLAYNLLFLSTFVLSGLGMYLFVRDLTGRPLAAFIAGVAFAFAPYRISQYSHLQVLSSYWMPFALLGLRRYFETRRTRPLAGAAAAVALQNLSCGYYLLYFAPFAACYALYEMAMRGLMRDWRVWRGLGLAAIAVALVTWPFVTPYLDVRKGGDVGVRSFEESMRFSADTHALATASSFSTLWGDEGIGLRVWPKGEGDGFPGVAIVALAAVAVGSAGRRAWRDAGWRRDRRWQRWTAIALAAALATAAATLAVMFVSGPLPVLVDGRPWRDSDPFLAVLVAAPIAFVALVPAVRRGLAAAHAASPAAFFMAAAALATLLAFGPRIQAGGELLGRGLYYWLWAYVPGFDGVRVPARFFMVAACFLAVLAGIGLSALLSRWPRRGRVLAAAACVAMLAESWVAPMPTNVRMTTRFYELPPRQLLMGERMSPIYQFVKGAPGKLVLIEFPFAEPGYEILATFYAGYHRKPIVNGYSGFFPEGYLRRATFLSYIPFDLDAATKALSTTGATHALVHEAAYPDGRGHEITDWLLSTGAAIVMTHGPDKLFQLK
jgi:hypothetical protein